MKKALFLGFITAIMLSCDVSPEVAKKRQESMSEKIYNDNIYVVEIDSCEYVVFNRHIGYSGAGGICHKGNCKYCAERKNKKQ
jgi:hypothetical protein